MRRSEAQLYAKARAIDRMFIADYGRGRRNAAHMIKAAKDHASAASMTPAGKRRTRETPARSKNATTPISAITIANQMLAPRLVLKN